MAIGLGSLEVVLEEGNRKDWFGSPLISQLAIVATLFVSLFLWIELTRRKPFINLDLLIHRNFGIGSIAGLALGLGLYGSIYLLPLYLSQIQHLHRYADWTGDHVVWLAAALSDSAGAAADETI